MARRSAARLPSDPEEARLQLLGVAEAAFERYGLNRTTMEDIALEAKVSRPTLYRYFGDRDSLVRAIAQRRAAAFVGRAHDVLQRYETLEEQLVEGMVFLAKVGHRDQFFSALLTHDTITEAHHILMGASAAIDFAAAVWGPLLDAADARGELRAGLDRPLAYRWLTSVNIILISDLEQDGDAHEHGHRAMLRNFVAPAFCEPARAQLTKNKKR